MSLPGSGSSGRRPQAGRARGRGRECCPRRRRPPRFGLKQFLWPKGEPGAARQFRHSRHDPGRRVRHRTRPDPGLMGSADGTRGPGRAGSAGDPGRPGAPEHRHRAGHLAGRQLGRRGRREGLVCGPEPGKGSGHPDTGAVHPGIHRRRGRRPDSRPGAGRHPGPDVSRHLRAGTVLWHGHRPAGVLPARLLHRAADGLTVGHLGLRRPCGRPPGAPPAAGVAGVPGHRAGRAAPCPAGQAARGRNRFHRRRRRVHGVQAAPVPPTAPSRGGPPSGAARR